MLIFFLTATKVINAGDNILVYDILFPIIGLIVGTLCALLVNKIIVNPIINLIKKIRGYSTKNKEV